MYTPQDVFDGYEDKIKRMAADIKQLQGDNAKLRAEIIALEGVAEIMDCGHERRFSTLQIGATGNESTCAICENERAKSSFARKVKEYAELSDQNGKLILSNERLKAALEIHPL